MSELQKLAWTTSSELYSAGFALATIGDLLGADGLEHYLDAKQVNGLRHAVKAIGSMVLACAGDLAEQADPDNSESST